jgi:hypothetical protein
MALVRMKESVQAEVRDDVKSGELAERVCLLQAEIDCDGALDSDHEGAPAHGGVP